MIIKCKYNNDNIPMLDYMNQEYLISSNFTEKNQDMLRYMDSIYEDLLNISLYVYAIDKCVERNSSLDGWTRELDVEIAVADPEFWENQTKKLQDILNFLSGDKWKMKFIKEKTRTRVVKSVVEFRKEYKIISMLSGGLDSYIGAIDLLEEIEDKKDILFLSYYGKGKATRPTQTTIKKILLDKYKLEDSNFMEFNVYIKNAKETTTRTRSFLFFTHAIIASVLSVNPKKLYIPENGFISLNIPITNSRIGSNSTRTTHPYYLKLLKEFYNELKLNVEIINPYKFKTKGEMMLECKNKELLLNTYYYTNSCSNPTKIKEPNVMHCGYCWPCLIRRASISHAQIEDKTRYLDITFSSKTAKILYKSYSFLLEDLKNVKYEQKVQESGPLYSDIEKYARVYKKGIEEIDKIIKKYESEEK